MHSDRLVRMSREAHPFAVSSKECNYSNNCDTKPKNEPKIVNEIERKTQNISKQK